jgi:polysaccharide export outer membrane protein
MLPGYACQAQTQAAQELPPAAAPARAAQEKPLEDGPANSETDAAKPTAASVAGVDPKTFIIGAEDVLTVRVWREPELSGQFMVRPDGRISLPLVNEILAAGQTPEQLTASIAQGLSKYMNRPEVAVLVTQVNSRKYYIQGEVSHPGAYPLVVPTTVLEALSNGGGFREFANTKKIIILRNGKERLQFNYRDVTKGRHTEQNIVLQPGDQIIVN